MNVETLPRPVIIKLPGHMFSGASQELRDQIDEWLTTNKVNDDDVVSCYLKDDEAEALALNGNLSFGSWSLKYIAFQFSDPKIAVLFKLTFG